MAFSTAPSTSPRNKFATPPKNYEPRAEGVRRAPARARRTLRASAVLPGRALNPVRQLLLSWLSVPTRSNAVDALFGP
jgi:hypothetical protein